MNNIHNVEIVIHVDDPLAGDQKDQLINKLLSHDGIEKATFTVGRDHILLVDYDREQLKALDVLGYVRKFHNAELVGPI